ncbi:MAG: B12-binding domain-containing radical SAM protein [Bacteroidales bacterium]|jgi:radical SAM superfamily enzyme YgiQ (UPF0313 family)
MVDVVLITSSSESLIKLSVYPYLGLGYLASELLESGFSVKLYDVDAERLNKKKIKRKLLADNPSFIGITVMTRSLPFVYKVVNLIKDINKETVIILGGPHVTSDPYIVNQMGLKYGLRGDSEKSFLNLINKLKNKNEIYDVPGLVFFDEHNIIINEKTVLNKIDVNLSNAFKLFNLKLYCDIVFPGVKSFTLDTSRGCPYNCIFCSNHSKTKVRLYEIELVFRNIKILVNEYNVKWIAFVDDLFTFKRERVIKLCEKIIEENLKFKWSCLTRVDWLDRDLLIIMKRAGLENIIFGVESGSEEIRKLVNKNIPNNKYFEILSLCKELNIKTLNTYIIGNPSESYSDMLRTIIYSIKLDSDLAHYQLMSPLPGSPIFDTCIAEKVFDSEVWNLYMQKKIKEPFFYPKGKKFFFVRIIHLLAYILFYLNPKKFVVIIKNVLKLLLYKLKQNIK